MQSTSAKELTSLDEEDITEKRVRTHTTGGMEMYESLRHSSFRKVEIEWSNVQACLEQLSTCKLNIEAISNIENSLKMCFENYCKQTESFFEFLERAHTEHSMQEHSMYSAVFKANKAIVGNAFIQLETSRNLSLENASRRSDNLSRKQLSARTNNSNVSSVLRKRAEAEAALTKVKFAEKEAAIRKQKALLAHQTADLEAELDVVSHKKVAAALKAEADVLEYDDSVNVNSDLDFKLSSLPLNTLERTKRYVQEQSSLRELNMNTQTDNINQNKHVDVTSVTHTAVPHQHIPFQCTPRSALAVSRVPSVSGLGELNRQEPTCVKLDANAPPFIFDTGQNNKIKLDCEQKEQIPNSVTSDLTRFFLKKELLLSRLNAFTDKPEMYAVWKTSFQSIMSELSVSPMEEMDLLVKWLGPESSRYAYSIRASNIGDASKGVKRLWERLDERYGAPELVESALTTKLRDFPKLTNRDSKRLYDLCDILSEIDSVKNNEQYRSLLAYYDSSSGILPIVNKLPHNIQEKWITRAASYKKRNGVSFPPFTVFVEFVQEMSKIRNDPGFAYEQYTSPKKDFQTRRTSNITSRPTIFSKKTEVEQENSVSQRICPVHNTRHSLNQCRSFRAKSLQERKKFLSEHKICYKCCDSDKHLKRDCTVTVKCLVCGSDRHPAALHNNPIVVGKNENLPSTERHGGEEDKMTSKNLSDSVLSKCTEICGPGFAGKSCAKIILVNIYPKGMPERTARVYAVFDDQSNRSLVKSDLFSKLNIHGREIAYKLSSCGGCVTASGRIAEGCVIESLDGTTSLLLPPLIECNDIPDIRDEIATPEVARMYPHLKCIQDYIPPLDESEILLLIGRDLIDAHHVLDHKIGPSGSPYAQRLPLGWVIVGETCLQRTHNSEIVNVNKTCLLSNGRPSLFHQCENIFNVRENSEEIGSSVFVTTTNDNKPGRSIEDTEFLELMNKEFCKDDHGNWVAPLPFRANRPRLPNNRSQAYKRAKTLHYNLCKDHIKREHMVTFMQRVFDSKHAEIAPPVTESQECWYLPIFGIYHPHKPDQIRAVFDSSAQYQGLSLNSVLLTGPDFTNSLLDVLIRFRMEPVAITADIQQMFHSFLVREEHRNYLRFFWYKNNNPMEDLEEYRMRVHVFGNRPSPSVANYGLRKTAEISQESFGLDVRKFINNNFYVDDGLVSVPTVNEAVDLMKRTQLALKEGGNLRLHKIASNKQEVMCAFKSEDLAKNLKDLDLSSDNLPLQHSLGIGWNLENDTFTFRVTSVDKPYTRRGVLSVINSIFDPLGFAAPVVIQGKLILRKLMSENNGWDDLLPQEYEPEWKRWKESLQLLQDVEIQRTYMNSNTSLHAAIRKELHVYSDASNQAIAAVAYIKTVSADNEHHVGYLLGKAKVAPTHGHSIPRLELCGAVLAIEIYECVSEALDLKFDCIKFYTDSKVVLGYIYNQKRRFFMYVCNRVQRIRRSSQPEQWTYVPTDLNPADCATRSVSAKCLQNCPWLKGPKDLLKCNTTVESPTANTFPLVDPSQDKEIKPEINVFKSSVAQGDLFSSHRFQRFSTWKKLVTTIMLLKHIAVSFHEGNTCKGWHRCDKARSVEAFQGTEKWIIQVVQREVFSEELTSLLNNRPVSKNSSILRLDPFIDEEGLLHVGGRLRRSSIDSKEKFPLIIPKRHHVALLLIRHYHETVFHQGRHFTDGAIRSAGLWIIGSKRLISSVIRKCVKCSKLRGKQEIQKMSDLPKARLDEAPPFTYIGVDVFGPWTIVTRRTRGGQAQNKRWAVMFTCLVIRAVHIEVIEDMTSSAFISALRRFIAIRGPVKEIYSDRGSNFVGSTDDLRFGTVNVEDPPMKDILFHKGTVWKFNPPHSSHMGGVWERMIGTTRKILAAMLSGVGRLTHEILVTFLAEVSAIINARPLVPVSTDSENPFVLSPSMILTHKTQNDVAPFHEFSLKDTYKAQWKLTQHLADCFWKRWRQEYLQTLQFRRKWQFEKPNIKCGDIVLLKQNDVGRNDWPMARVENVFPGQDNRVRKVEVRVTKDGKAVFYTRPITEVILLLNE